MDDVTQVFAADGRPGADGAAGQSWSNSASTGSDGRDGGHGQAGSAGGNAGQVHATVVWDDDQVRINATNGSDQFRHAFACDQGDVIGFSARGGDGGDGGDAGRGQDGGRGRRGSDATPSSSAGNGGDGGDGGNAGEPGRGGDAGNGGEIIVSVTEDDMDLLIAVRTDARAGEPGDGGNGASGGDGGSGGSGGSGCSWEEPYTATEHYTDSNGRTQTRTVTKTRSHSRSSGFSGSSGRDGRRSSVARAAAGRAAQDGTVRYIVATSEGQRSYDSIYDPVVVATVLEPCDQRLFDGDVFEPGQVLALTEIEIVNTGGMPTPSTRDAELCVVASGDIEPRSTITIPRGIAPGQRVRIRASEPNGHLAIIDRRASPVEAWSHEVAIAVAIRVGRLQRLQQVTHRHAIATRSPITLRAIDLFRSLGAGEATRLHWRIDNGSLCAFGVDAPAHQRVAQPPRSRSVRVEVADHGGDADAQAFAVLHDQRAITLPQITAIARIDPGQSASGALTVGWRSGAPPFTGRTLGIALRVDAADETMRTVQQRPELIKVAPRYVHDPEASVLLITNHGTTLDEVQHWRSFLRSLELPCDVFDLAREGSVDLDLRVSALQTLREEWRGRTVIALNNEWTGPQGQTSAADYIFDRQIVSALVDDGISFYAPGTGRPLLTAEALRSSRRASRVSRSLTCDVGALDAVARAHGAASGDESAEDLHITLTTRPWWAAWRGEPSPSVLSHAARRLSASLAMHHPGRRYAVIYRAQTAQRAPDHRWTIGSITLTPLPDGGAASFAAVREADIHRREWITSVANKAALILALPMEEKLRLFTNLVLASYNHDLHPERARLAEAYADAIIVDSALEQESIRDCAWHYRTWSLRHLVAADERPWAERLQRVCTTGLIAALPAGSARGRILARLLGGLHAVVDACSPGWDLLWPVVRHRAITSQCRRALAGLEQAGFGQRLPIFHMPGEPWSDAPSNQKAARRRIREHRRNAAQRYAQLRRARRSGDRLGQLIAAVCPSYDVEACVLRRLLRDHSERVMIGYESDRAAAAQDTADALTAARIAGHHAERARLVTALPELSQE